MATKSSNKVEQSVSPATVDTACTDPTSRYFKSDIVTVTVGPEATDFHVHKDLLMASSSFFNAALQEDCYKEGAGGKLHLYEEMPAAFEGLLLWLYAKQVREIENKEEEGIVVRLYVMAGKLGA